MGFYRSYLHMPSPLAPPLGERRIVNTLKEASSVCPSSASAPTQSSRGLAEEEVTIYQSGISSTNTLSQNLGKESKVGRAHFQV